uniref:C2H2-type domain-containing protein n=1 Tax=Oxyrrhis marina TaxID=2969 RepID=A0A7S3UMV5_OXYMA|mmetsp:Transcript_2252/g.3421  ORF Transcript_2252/g.3421 Transcript_2252/m.3421 type:complete len:159 (+) Transcript_2252:48-524(+)
MGFSWVARVVWIVAASAAAPSANGPRCSCDICSMRDDDWLLQREADTSLKTCTLLAPAAGRPTSSIWKVLSLDEFRLWFCKGAHDRCNCVVSTSTGDAPVPALSDIACTQCQRDCSLKYLKNHDAQHAECEVTVNNTCFCSFGRHGRWTRISCPREEL